jgi:putative FmdB family regulatory protein
MTALVTFIWLLGEGIASVSHRTLPIIDDMPTYEYACSSCGTHVEVFQRFNDEPLTECGVCGGPLRKVFHPAGILFKGSGFYATDSRAARSKAGTGSGDGGSESSKADSKKADAKGADSKASPSKSSSGDRSKERSA